MPPNSNVFNPNNTTVWDEFMQRAQAQGKLRIVLHMMIGERRGFAEAAAFVGFQYPEGD
jgi:hypothetical protein